MCHAPLGLHLEWLGVPVGIRWLVDLPYEFTYIPKIKHSCMVLNIPYYSPWMQEIYPQMKMYNKNTLKFLKHVLEDESNFICFGGGLKINSLGRSELSFSFCWGPCHFKELLFVDKKSGRIMIFHEPRFFRNKGISLPHLPFGFFWSCDVAII